MPPLRVHIATVGCRANQADSAWLARQLDPKDFSIVGRDEAAAVTIVNSCAVTAAAERDVRKAIHRARRLGGGDAKIILTGCMVTASPTAVKELEPLWQVIPGPQRATIPVVLRSLLSEERRRATEEDSRIHQLPAVLHRARPSLRVQDGCRMRCAYCAVPAGRGPESSTTLEVVQDQIKQLAAEGAREVVLCGINLGSWGRDLQPRRRLAHLIEVVGNDCPVERIRLSSIEPWAIDDHFIDVFASTPVVAPHLHLPLQSGDDEVLRRMRRPYRSERYVRILEKILAQRSETAITTDVIAGFPGETEAAFERTVTLIRELPFTMLHVFGFSPRPGTEAAHMTELVPRELIHDRVALLRELGAQKRADFARELVGQVVRPLFERSTASGDLRGITGRFCVARARGAASLVGKLTAAKVERAGAHGELEVKLISTAG